MPSVHQSSYNDHPDWLWVQPYTTPYGLFLLIFIITQRYRLCITLSLHMQDWRPKETKVLVWSQTVVTAPGRVTRDLCLPSASFVAWGAPPLDCSQPWPRPLSVLTSIFCREFPLACGVCCGEPVLFWFSLSFFLVYRVDTRDRGPVGVEASAWWSGNSESSGVPLQDVVECISTPGPFHARHCSPWAAWCIAAPASGFVFKSEHKQRTLKASACLYPSKFSLLWKTYFSFLGTSKTSVHMHGKDALEGVGPGSRHSGVCVSVLWNPRRVAFTLLDLGSLTWDSKGDQSVPSELLARFSSTGLARRKCLVDVH